MTDRGDTAEARPGRLGPAAAPPTPLEEGFAAPARFAPHARSFMSWPTARDYRWSIERARAEHAAIAEAIAAFEPVTMIVDPADAGDAAAMLGPEIERIELALDDAWIRDNGPIFVADGAGRIAGVDFAFNSWGLGYASPDDDRLPARLAARLGLRCFDAPLVLEGGAFGVDGEGTLVTTEQCLLNPNRNPGMSRARIERGLRAYLGVETVIWLGYGLVEDTGTSGHVDNVCQFVAPGVVLAQTVNDPGNPNYALLRDNLARLRAARDAKGRRLEVVELDLLPYTEQIEGVRYPVPYVNFHYVNGGLIVPAPGAREDDAAHALLAELFPERRLAPVPSTALAVDGGGVGCVTQQMPVGTPAT